MGKGNVGIILGETSGQEGLLDGVGFHLDYVLDTDTGLAATLDYLTSRSVTNTSDWVYDSAENDFFFVTEKVKRDYNWAALGLRKYFDSGNLHPYLGGGWVQLSIVDRIRIDGGDSTAQGNYQGVGSGQFLSTGFLWSEEGPGFTFGLDFSKYAVSYELCQVDDSSDCLDEVEESTVRQTVMVGYSF